MKIAEVYNINVKEYKYIKSLYNNTEIFLLN